MNYRSRFEAISLSERENRYMFFLIFLRIKWFLAETLHNVCAVSFLPRAIQRASY